MSLHYFPASYQASRARFRQNLSRVQRYWPTARLEHHTINPDEDLTIDWICADAMEDKRRQVIFTTGEHGVEGFVGSAILQLFLEEFLGSLDARRTGLLLVHAINPWGMHNWRRVNCNNVDLNRNFIWGPGGPDQNSNPDYRLLQGMLNPAGAVKSIPSATTIFALRLLEAQLKYGASRFKNAALMGQYHTPSGVYYGGSQLQPETRMLMELYEQHTRSCDHILHLDMHTGYGPRYQMSLVNSALESRSSVDFARNFGYPLVVKTNAAEFYPIQGDMVDWVYHYVQETTPGAACMPLLLNSALLAIRSPPCCAACAPQSLKTVCTSTALRTMIRAPASGQSTANCSIHLKLAGARKLWQMPARP